MLTEVLGKNGQGQRGVFIQTDRISELDFFCDMVREINDQRRLWMNQRETLRFFGSVSSLVGDKAFADEPEYVDWAVESAAAALRIATEA